MNEHLSHEIFELVRTMTPEEKKAFKQFVKDKKQVTGEINKTYKYQQLFDLYVAQNIKRQEEGIPELQKEAKKFSNSFDDLNQQLFGRLEKFLVAGYRKKTEFEGEYKISELLDTAAAFRERKRNKIAASYLVKATELINALRKTNTNREWLMYLSIRLAALDWDIRVDEKIYSKNKIQADEFEQESRPFMTLAKAADEHIVQPRKGQLEIFANPEFQHNAFFSLLGIYLRERKEYNILFKTIGRRAQFGKHTREKYITDKPDQYSKNKNALLEKIIDTEEVLMQIEKLFYAVKVNDYYGFDETMHSLLHNIHSAYDTERHNTELAAFIYRQTFELKTIFSDPGNTTDVYHLKKLNELTLGHLKLFTNEEVKKIPLRIELNTIIVYFLTKQFKDIVALSGELGNQKLLNQYASYYPDVVLAEIISRIESLPPDDLLEKRIRYYKEYTANKKYTVPPFHKKFDDFIYKYMDRAIDRKEISRKYLEKIEPLRESFNHFHHVFIQWLRSKC